MEKFNINAKALSKLLTRHQYMGGSDPRKKQTTIIQGEKGKLVLAKKRKSVSSKVAIKDPDDDGDDDDNRQGKQLPQKKPCHDESDM